MQIATRLGVAYHAASRLVQRYESLFIGSGGTFFPRPRIQAASSEP